MPRKSKKPKSGPAAAPAEGSEDVISHQDAQALAQMYVAIFRAFENQGNCELLLDDLEVKSIREMAIDPATIGTDGGVGGVCKDFMDQHISHLNVPAPYSYQWIFGYACADREDIEKNYKSDPTDAPQRTEEERRALITWLQNVAQRALRDLNVAIMQHYRYPYDTTCHEGKSVPLDLSKIVEGTQRGILCSHRCALGAMYAVGGEITLEPVKEGELSNFPWSLVHPKNDIYSYRLFFDNEGPHDVELMYPEDGNLDLSIIDLSKEVVIKRVDSTGQVMSLYAEDDSVINQLRIEPRRTVSIGTQGTYGTPYTTCFQSQPFRENPEDPNTQRKVLFVHALDDSDQLLSTAFKRVVQTDISADGPCVLCGPEHQAPPNVSQTWVYCDVCACCFHMTCVKFCLQRDGNIKNTFLKCSSCAEKFMLIDYMIHVIVVQPDPAFTPEVACVRLMPDAGVDAASLQCKMSEIIARSLIAGPTSYDGIGDIDNYMYRICKFERDSRKHYSEIGQFQVDFKLENTGLDFEKGSFVMLDLDLIVSVPEANEIFEFLSTYNLLGINTKACRLWYKNSGTPYTIVQGGVHFPANWKMPDVYRFWLETMSASKIASCYRILFPEEDDICFNTKETVKAATEKGGDLYKILQALKDIESALRDQQHSLWYIKHLPQTVAVFVTEVLQALQLHAENVQAYATTFKTKKQQDSIEYSRLITVLTMVKQCHKITDNILQGDVLVERSFDMYKIIDDLVTKEMLSLDDSGQFNNCYALLSDGDD